MHKDSSFNIRDLVMRTPASTSPERSPELYKDEKRAKPLKQDTIAKPSPAAAIKSSNDKLAQIIKELSSFDVRTIQRRSDPRMKALCGQINDILAEIFGRNSDEYDDYVIYSLDTLPITIGGSWHPLPEVQEGYRKGIQSAITKLTSLLVIQKSKLEIVSGEKPARNVVNEPSVNQVITGKEKVSLVNLRGKIRSRETVFFSQCEGTENDHRKSHSNSEESDTRARAIKRFSQNNHCKPIQTETEVAMHHTGDEESIQKINPDNNKPVLLENLEEKLKTLESEPVFKDKENEFVETEHDPLFGKPNHEESPLSTLVMQLNEIVTSDPGYTETRLSNVTGSNEKNLSFMQKEGGMCIGFDEESATPSFERVAEIYATDSEISEIEEVLVIDGDDILSTEDSFIQTLENEDREQEIAKSAINDECIDRITDGKKRISLDELQQKLREFEGKEFLQSEPLNDFENKENEEAFLVDGADCLPEEMMKELVQEAGSLDVCEIQPPDREVLIIDGDVDPDQHAFSVDDDEEPHEIEAHESLTQEKNDDEGMLVIECDSGLPEELLNELGQEDSLVCKEDQLQRPLKNVEVGENLTNLSEQYSLDRSMIIDLCSSTVSLNICFLKEDDGTKRETILEDLEKRLTHFSLLGPGEESLHWTEVYDVEKVNSVAAQGQSDMGTNEDHASSGSPIETEQTYVDLLHSFDVKNVFSAGFDKDFPLKEIAISNEAPEFSDVVGCDENAIMECTDRLLPVCLDVLHCVAVDNILVEDIAFIEQNKKLPDQNIIIEKVCEECSDYISFNNLESLTDHTSEMHITTPVEFFDVERMFEENNDEKHFDGDLTDFCQLQPVEDWVDSNNGDQQEFKFIAPEAMKEEPVPFFMDEELTDQVAEKLCVHNEETFEELPQLIFDPFDGIDNHEFPPITGNVDLTVETAEHHIVDSILMNVNEELLVKPGTDESASDDISRIIESQITLPVAIKDLMNDSLMIKSDIEIPESLKLEEPFSPRGREEYCTFDINDAFVPSIPDTTIEIHNNALFEPLRHDLSDNEPLPCSIFEECIVCPDASANVECKVDENLRETILLEALEKMLIDLESDVSEQSHVDFQPITTKCTPLPEEEKTTVLEPQKESPQETVLIKTPEERSNPFAMTGMGREKTNAKMICADDLQVQIGELRYRIDDLRTFDIDSIDQRFDPRVRALGDTVNNTIADIFGRNTPSYWQHALPSLDSLPVVVGGPKLSPEELRGAYRKRINEAIAKVNVTISMLETKLGKVKDKGVNKEHFQPITTKCTPLPEEEKTTVLEPQKESPQETVLIKTPEERSNPFAMTGMGREKTNAKMICADDLQVQIGELRYRIDDLRTFDIDSIDQRFDPRVRALGDTVNNTIADIFGRNTPSYWQHALPSLDSLPVVVGGPKLSPEELRGAYRKRINEAIAKVNVTISMLETKLGKVKDKTPSGQVLFFSQKTNNYKDVQSLH
ncbi:MAG TPA: hypothetical protein PLN83_08130 [Syntrophorhabdus sp.]|nr:hypothetical protein [Syntrophorhabdus sp.]